MRKFCPVGFSLGITLWQVEQGSPVCWLNTGIASAFSGATIAGKLETAMLTRTVPNNTRGHMADEIFPSEGVTGHMIGCTAVASVVWTEVPSSSVEPHVFVPTLFEIARAHS